MLSKKLFGLIGALLLTSSAARAEPADGDWQHRMWIAKAGRVLSAGVPLTPAEISALAPLSQDEVVDELMNRGNFGDAVLDFNLFYLGFRPARLYTSNFSVPGVREYDYIAFAKPQAIAAAKAVLAGGDYFDILSLELPKYLAPFDRPQIYDPQPHDPSQPTPTDDEIRAQLLSKALTAFDKVSGYFHVAGSDQLDKAAGCRQASDDTESNTILQDTIDEGGFPFVEQFDLLIYPSNDINLSCGDPGVTAEEILGKLAALRESYVRLFESAATFKRDAYPIRSFADIKALSGENLPVWLKSTQFGFFGFWQNLPNSSTNYNRKRAAYMLKTYFCDDLTPLGVVSSGGPHAGGGHASDPSCQSCHYKLDPMAGFFRDKGISGIDFENRPFLVFDDQAIITGDQLNRYHASWEDIGYIRSTRNRDDNDYGRSLADLFGILHQAPEVKQCLVRRMAEYFLGKNQVFDGGWLAHLTETFNQDGPSSAAYKSVVKQLVTSNTFSNPDPASDQCYDFYPAAPGPNALPCAVAHVVHNNCALCHSSANARGGLDMSRWIEIGRDDQGRSIMNFPHVDAAGNQQGRATTLARLSERLNTPDPARSMPKNMDMNAVDKARLFQWVVQQVP